VPTPEIERTRMSDELEVAVAARGELGADFEPQVIESFLDRVEKGIEARVDARLERHSGGRHDSREALGVVLGSLGIGIPLTGAAGGTTGLAGILVVWVGIVLVNFAYALARSRR
jgi:hypothetical protein